MISYPDAAEQIGSKLPKLTTNMLSYQRSLEIGEASMSALSLSALDKVEKGSNWLAKAKIASTPVEVREKGLRGQSSHANPKTKELKPGASNPQIVDVAYMPGGAEYLLINFSMKVLSNAMKPSATDNPDVARGLAAFTQHYAQAGGFEYLAARYIANIANGRFAWRNRGLADDARVGIAWVDASRKEQFISFDPLAFDLESMADTDDMEEAILEGDRSDLDALIKAFASALDGSGRLSLKVGFMGEMIPDAEIYPSQEYVRDDEKQRLKKSRFLSSVNRMIGGQIIRAATMHNQKIGAAIRCIDDWHADAEFAELPVPVNPYAGMQEMNLCLRHPDNKRDFYSLRKSPKEAWERLLAGEITDDAHFIAANLIRGGVYGQKPE